MMRQGARTSRWIAGLLCVCWLVSTMGAALAVPYPYEAVCGENVNLRKTASASAVILKRLQAGDSVTILGVRQLLQPQGGGVTGYALKEYVDGVSRGGAGTQGGLLPARSRRCGQIPYDTNTIERVKLRKTDNATADVLLSIPGDEIITVLSLTSTGFAKVKYKEKPVCGQLLCESGNIPAPTPKDRPPPAPTRPYTALQKGSAG